MRYKSTLTNEALRGKFPSNFELVNYAIRLAENMVRTGRAPRVHSEIDNPAVQVLEEIAVGKDQFVVEQEVVVIPENERYNGRSHTDHDDSRHSPRKRK